MKEYCMTSFSVWIINMLMILMIFGLPPLLHIRESNRITYKTFPFISHALMQM